MKRFIVIVGTVAFGLAAAQANPDPDAVVGRWHTDGKESQIEIFKEADAYHGKIVWLKEPNYPDDHPEAGKPKRDNNNPDPARQNDPILGLRLLRDFRFDGASAWSGGTVYDPEEGKTYKCTMRLKDDKTLAVRGYIGIPAFGRSTTWTRVELEEHEGGQAVQGNEDAQAVSVNN